jgi:RNA polymerase sigma-70 factor (ECF subfamily)
MDTDTTTEHLLTQARAGDGHALNELFRRHRDRLKRMVRLRLDPRMQQRVDESDVVQEALVDVASRLPEYLAQPKLPFYLWLRLVTSERLLKLHRTHLGTQMRAAQRERTIDGPWPAASSLALAAQLLGNLTAPSQAAQRAERQRQVQMALEQLDPADREVLALRHFEELSRSETAQVLGISEAAAAKRYLRALQRLRKVLPTGD